MPAPDRLKNYVHYRTPGVSGALACGLQCSNDDWYIQSTDTFRVTCPACLGSAEVQNLRRETAGRPAESETLPVHFQRRGSFDVACGRPGWALKSTDKDEVTCLQCKLTDVWLATPPIPTQPVTAARPAVTEVIHLTTSLFLAGPAICGTSEGMVTATPGMVTCPDCINIHSRKAEEAMTKELLTEDLPEAEGETARSGPPSQEEITNAHLHDWNMSSPYHEHDCDRCLYLGSSPGTGGYVDLYFCDQDNQRPTVVVRHGEGGDYTSGMDFVDRIPKLALAYVRAQRAGLL